MYMSIAALGLAWVTIEQSIHHRIVGRDSSYGLAAVWCAFCGWLDAGSIPIMSYLVSKSMLIYILYGAADTVPHIAQADEPEPHNVIHES